MTKLDEIKAAVAEYEAASRATFELVVAEKVDQTAVNKAHATLEAIEAKLAQVAPDYLKALLPVVEAAKELYTVYPEQRTSITDYGDGERRLVCFYCSGIWYDDMVEIHSEDCVIKKLQTALAALDRD